MLHYSYGIGRVMGSACFLQPWCLGFRPKSSIFEFIWRPENFVPNLRVLQASFGKLQVCSYWGVVSILLLYHAGLAGEVLQKRLSCLHRTTLELCQSDCRVLGHKQLLTLAWQPALGPGGFKRLPLTDDGGHCAHWDFQNCRNYSVPFLRSVLDTILS